MGSEDFSDLLIFKSRGINVQQKQKKEEPTPEVPKAEPKVEKPAAKVEKPAAKVEKPAPKVEKLVPQPQVAPERPLPPPEPVVQNVEPQRSRPAQKEDVSSKTCINHPWRSAYGYCAKDGLPYCFVDLVDYGGKSYCLNDIDAAMRVDNEEPKEAPRNNSISAFSSALVLINAAVLFYFANSQMQFIAQVALQHGIANFIVNFNALYTFPVADIIVIAVSIASAISLLRNSLVLFAIAFVSTFGSAFLMAYQYLSTSIAYSLISSVILLIASSAMVYSRMSAFSSTATEVYATPDIAWPKPEAF